MKCHHFENDSLKGFQFISPRHISIVSTGRHEDNDWTVQDYINRSQVLFSMASGSEFLAWIIYGGKDCKISSVFYKPVPVITIKKEQGFVKSGKR